MQPYLSLTLPTSNIPNTAVRVCCLQIATVSHDQGYSGHPGQHGTYGGSHTYFDVRIKEPSGQDRMRHRAIIHNIHALYRPTRHVKYWIQESEQDDPPADTNSPAKDGAWLAEMQGGDTVQIIPMAEYPAWINFVLGARIEVWYEVVERVALIRGITHSTTGFSLYRQLDNARKEIRLVTIEPSPDLENSVLELSLTHTYLTSEDHVPYEALSYCWGDDRHKRPILLKGSDEDLDPEAQPEAQTFVSKSLYLALKALRRASTPRTFWIDQLCINQTELEERAEQVSLMGDIYTSAQNIRIWLGELEDDVKEDFAILKSIYDAYAQGKKLSDDAGPEQISLTPQISHKLITSDGNVHMSHDRVFHRPWFERVWVLQEVWNTPRQCTAAELSQRATVLCGAVELPWSVVMRANQCIQSNNGSSYNSSMPAIWGTLFHPPDRMAYHHQNHFHAPFKPRARLDVLTVLVAALEMRATDPRDKFFALLAFGEETHAVRELPDLVRPDYAKSVRRVYADFTRWWIRHHRSLGVLSAVHTLTGRTWLDMWKGHDPHGRDFSVNVGEVDEQQPPPPSWSFWCDGRSEWRRATLGTSDHDDEYNASGGREVDLELVDAASLTESPYTLSLRGVRLGTIRSKRPYPFHRRPVLSEAMHLAYARIFDPASTIGTWGHAKLLTHLPVMDHGQLPYHYFSHWRNASRYALDETSGLVGEEEDEDTPDYLPCHGECMFDTETHVGLCPSGSRVGDVVVVLFGGRVPYLLRPAGEEGKGEYRLVGECYVEGVMQGEGFEERVAGHEEVFTLI